MFKTEDRQAMVRQLLQDMKAALMEMTPANQPQKEREILLMSETVRSLGGAEIALPVIP